MTDIERIRDIVNKAISLIKDVYGLLNDIEKAKDTDKETIERLEVEVWDLTNDLEKARREE